MWNCVVLFAYIDFILWTNEMCVIILVDGGWMVDGGRSWLKGRLVRQTAAGLLPDNSPLPFVTLAMNQTTGRNTWTLQLCFTHDATWNGAQIKSNH